MFPDTPDPRAKQALRDVTLRPFWWDSPDAPPPVPPLIGTASTDLLVVGGGFTGLWTAIIAKQRAPERDVIIVEADVVAGQASGRNGGFVHASLTHGPANGMARYPQDYAELRALGDANLEAIRTFIRDNEIACDWRDAGELEVAFTEHDARRLHQEAHDAAAFGEHLEWLDSAALRERISMDGVLGATFAARDVSIVHPAKLAWGLRRIALALGVRFFEHTKITQLERAGAHMRAYSASGRIECAHIVLATNAFPSLLPSVRRRIVPVYDYVLMTEPLNEDQWRATGWQRHEGLKGAGNRFHYGRPTADGRILWGGFDAVYHRGNGIGPAFEHSQRVYEKLADHFVRVFPQLEGVRFTHAWGGAIDTCTRFIPFWTPAFERRVVSVAGFTGLGVGSSRFAAGVALDMLAGGPVTAPVLTRTRPIPFPPEPLRTGVITLTQRALESADQRGGRRSLWLRTLDALGIGFDS